MALESDTGQCANKEAEPYRGWTLGPEWGGLGGPTLGNVPARRLSPKKGGHEVV